MQPVADDDFDVWPDNWDTVAFFCSLRTQWTWVGTMTSVHRIGLDYGKVESVMRIKRIASGKRAALLDELQLMETAALEVWHAEK